MKTIKDFYNLVRQKHRSEITYWEFFKTFSTEKFYLLQAFFMLIILGLTLSFTDIPWYGSIMAYVALLTALVYQRTTVTLSQKIFRGAFWVLLNLMFSFAFFILINTLHWI